MGVPGAGVAGGLTTTGSGFGGAITGGGGGTTATGKGVCGAGVGGAVTTGAGVGGTAAMVGAGAGDRAFTATNPSNTTPPAAPAACSGLARAHLFAARSQIAHSGSPSSFGSGG